MTVVPMVIPWASTTMGSHVQPSHLIAFDCYRTKFVDMMNHYYSYLNAVHISCSEDVMIIPRAVDKGK